jgi:hypothetical protein
MSAPYDLQAIATMAESRAESLIATDTYDKSAWDHPIVGPLVRAYALLTHRPYEALGDRASPERIAECRVYSYVYLTAVHVKLTGDTPQRYSEGFVDLVSEYDRLAEVDFIAIHDDAVRDAIEFADQLPWKDRKKGLTRFGSVRRKK